MALPWGVLVANLPTLIDTAGKLFKKADEAPHLPPQGAGERAQLDALARRLEYFEHLEAEQARLLQQTIEQLQQVTLRAAAAERRANMALGVAVVGAVLSMVAVVAVLG